MNTGFGDEDVVWLSARGAVKGLRRRPPESKMAAMHAHPSFPPMRLPRGVFPITGPLALSLALLLGASASMAACDDGPDPAVNWAGCEKHRLILRKADLRGAKLAGVDLNGSDLESAILTGVDMSRASLDRVRLSSADLSGAKLHQLSAYRTNFTKARLGRVDLTKGELARANLTEADLSGANLTKAEFPRASLRGAQLAGANLTGADLSRTDLAGAKLAGARLTQARMYLTRIEGLDLSQTVGLVQAQVDTACGDAKTVLPKGLKSSAQWPCPKDD